MANDVLDTKTANQLAAGAPGTIDLGGQLYLISQPTKADFMTLRKELVRQWKAAQKAQKDDTLQRTIKDVAGMPPDLQRMAIDSAVKTSAAREPSSGDLEELLLEKPGVAFWTWLLARKSQPSVKLADIQAAITDENINEIIGQILDANGLKEASPN